MPLSPTPSPSRARDRSRPCGTIPSWRAASMSGAAASCIPRWPRRWARNRSRSSSFASRAASGGGHVLRLEGEGERVVAERTVKSPGRSESVPCGEILLASATGTGPVHARHHLGGAKLPQAGDEPQNEEGRDEHEV